MDKLNLSDIIKINFPDNQYYKEEINKEQIVLHHTVSGVGIDGDIAHWIETTERIATCVIVDREGKIHQCFSSKYWGHHLGITKNYLKDNGYSDYNERNLILNKKSIAIELDSWGGLVKYNNKWYPAINETTPNLKSKPIENITEYSNGYRGYYAFEKYSDIQIESTIKLIEYWCDTYNITKTYNEDMWDVSQNAIKGNNGIWSHTSYRKDKSDCHPQPELISSLKGI
jgi:N-acetyl-anhydromuramyl-L-alanine amidase AmpD